jgi:arginase
MNKKIGLVGVPMDLGQSRRGVDMGPSALRYSGVRSHLGSLGYEVEERGNIEIAERDTLADKKGLDFLPQVVEICSAIYDKARQLADEDAIPLFLGGDHSIAIGTVGGVTHSHRSGLIWVDAHGDFNTPKTSPSGNIHGMPMAVLLGHGPKELVDIGRPGTKIQAEDVVMIGIRDLDPQERLALRASGIKVFTMHDIDEYGMARIAAQALDTLSHLDRFHVSLDMDAVDPSWAPGVGTPVPGGLSYRESHLLMEILAESQKVCSADVVEVNPILDEQNKTAVLARLLLMSLFGQRVF